MVLVIQNNIPMPPRGNVTDTARKMEVGDMVVCKPNGRTNSNRYFSSLHRVLIKLGYKARSERVVVCASCGTQKDMSVRRRKCVECGRVRMIALVRTWRTA